MSARRRWVPPVSPPVPDVAKTPAPSRSADLRGSADPAWRTIGRRGAAHTARHAAGARGVVRGVPDSAVPRPRTDAAPPPPPLRPARPEPEHTPTRPRANGAVTNLRANGAVIRLRANGAVTRLREVVQGVRPAWIPARRGVHRAGGVRAGLAAYRQPALLAAIVAAAVLLMAHPSEPPPDARQTAGQAAARVTPPAATPPAARPDGGGRQQSRTRPGPTTTAGDAPRTPAAAPPVSAPAAAAPAGTTPGASVAPSTSVTASPSPTAPTGPARSEIVTGTDAVALTFDDGPDPVLTPKLLDLLAKEKVRATFCVVGTQAKAFPDLVRRIAADGHALCNHSWNHSFKLGRAKPEDIRADLARTNAAIRAAVPDARISYFRAPGGNFTEPLVRTAEDLGMASIYWQVDPRDWEHKDGASADQHVQRIVASVQRETRPGSIVLSHDFAQPTTIRAYEVLLPWLRERFILAPLP